MSDPLLKKTLSKYTLTIFSINKIQQLYHRQILQKILTLSEGSYCLTIIPP